MKIIIFENDALAKLRECEGDIWSSRQLIRDPNVPNLFNLIRLWEHYIHLHRKNFVAATDKGLEAASKEIGIDPYLPSKDPGRSYKLKYNGQLMCYGKINGRGNNGRSIR